MAEIAAVILAAGQASRYRAADPGAVTKLVAPLDGAPLVRHVANAALASRARPVIVVVGHAQAAVRSALQGLDVMFVENADYACGLSTSLRAGIAAAPPESAGAVILLADMPRVRAPLIDALVDAFARTPGCDAATPMHEGVRGNPVLLGRTLFEAVEALSGDEGARRLLTRPGLRLAAVEAGAEAAFDIDTPDALSS